MTGVALLTILGFSLLSSHPESTTVVVANLLEEVAITSVHLLLPNAEEMISIPFNDPLQPGETAQLSFPWGYINRVVFNTDFGDVYFQSGFAALSNPDTLTVTLARKEFGGVFDRIYGTMPIALRNSTSVNIASVRVVGDSTLQGNILGSNPLMPGEFLRLWVESTESYKIVFQDEDANYSEELTAFANPDTVYSVNNQLFYRNGTEHLTQGTGYSFTVSNCISSQEILGVETFDELGYSLVYIDLADNPLETWDRIVLHTDFPPSFVSCIDCYGRTYSLDEPNSFTGSYDFDQLSLDFNFSFPEGR